LVQVNWINWQLGLEKISVKKRRRITFLEYCGMARVFTALFGAPLGGIYFIGNTLHHKHAVEYYKKALILPALVAK